MHASAIASSGRSQLRQRLDLLIYLNLAVPDERPAALLGVHAAACVAEQSAGGAASRQPSRAADPRKRRDWKAAPSAGGACKRMVEAALKSELPGTPPAIPKGCCCCCVG